MGLLSWLLGPKVDTVEVAEVQERQAEGAIVVDVREPHEWSSGHIKGARLVPMGSLDRELSKMRPNRQLLFVCQSGRRAAHATDRAQKQGLTAANVRGGMLQWTRAGLPVKTGLR